MYNWKVKGVFFTKIQIFLLVCLSHMNAAVTRLYLINVYPVVSPPVLC